MNINSINWVSNEYQLLVNEEQIMTTTDLQPCVEEELIDVHPWRRYFARYTDICFIALFCMIVDNLFPEIFISYNQFVENKHYINYLIIGIAIMFINTAFISLTGTTIGKFLFGVRIVNVDNRRLNFLSALYRECLVVVIGLVFYLPFINFVPSYFSYVRLTTTGKTRWDDILNCNVFYRANNIKQKLFCFIGTIFYLFLSLVLYAITRHQ